MNLKPAHSYTFYPPPHTDGHYTHSNFTSVTTRLAWPEAPPPGLWSQWRANEGYKMKVSYHHPLPVPLGFPYVVDESPSHLLGVPHGHEHHFLSLSSASGYIKSGGVETDE